MTALTAPWRAALEEAWTAYCEGSLPIGACVADGQGQVIAVGRNRLGEARRVDAVIGGHDLAHAEINALLALAAVPRPDCRTWTVYTTVEPCPQCAGAVTMSGIRGLSYAAPDPWAGCADLLTSHPYMQRKAMRVERAPEAVIQAATLLQLIALYEEEREVSPVLDAYAQHHGAAVERAGHLHVSGDVHRLRARRATLDEALALLT